MRFPAAIAVALLATSLACFFAWKSPPPRRVVAHVPFVEWREDAAVWPEIVRRGVERPLLFRGAAARGWPALTRWREAGFWAASEHVTKPLRSLKQQTHSQVFKSCLMERPLADAVRQRGCAEWQVPGRPNFTVLDEMPMGKVVRRMKRARRKGEYLYAQDGVGLLREVGLDIVPGLDLLASAGRPIDTCDVNVWFGSPATTAFAHYDSDSNVFVQVVGRKRWRLAPLEAYTEMGLYPSLHPMWRQAHEDLLDPAMDQRATSFEVFDAVLEPGDVLWIPPWYWHRVESLEGEPGFVASVNIWCKGDEGVHAIQDRIREHPIPFEQDFDTPMRVEATLRLFGAVLGHIAHIVPDGIRSPRAFLRSLLDTRYRPLFAGDKAACKLCPGSAQECDADVRAQCATRDGLPAELQDKISAAGKSIAALYSDDMGAHHAAVMLGNWVEEAAAWAVGADRVCSFLACCGEYV